MARALGTTIRVVGRGGGDDHCQLAEGILPRVRIVRWVLAVVFEGPGGNALLVEIGILQVVDPAEQRDVLFDDGPQAFAGVCAVGRYAWTKLGDQTGVIEMLLFVGT